MLREVLFALLLVTAGCLGQTDEPGDQNDSEDQDPAEISAGNPANGTFERVTRTLVYEANLSGPDVGTGQLGIEWPAEFGVGLLRLELDMSWRQASNNLGLEVDDPDGDTERFEPQAPTGTRVQGTLSDVGPGTYAFYPTSSGPVVEDKVHLNVTATFELPENVEPDIESATIRGQIQTEETSDGWRAWVVHRSTGEARATMSLEASTVNGQIELAGDGEGAYASVMAWARGDTEQEARDRLEAVEVTLSVSDGHLEAMADSDSWEQRGADIEARVPPSTTLEGNAGTTNGQITLDELAVQDFSVGTTNGQIEGSLTAAGSFSAGTTNGEIDLALEPTGDLSLDAGNTNGDIQLDLLESDQIGYIVDASTSNGEISESMDEASLDGDEQAATLRTQNAQNREIQVQGTASTTNGDIDFDGR